MINNELLTFIKERVAQGSTHEQITDMLVTHGGWDKIDVEEAFDTVSISGTSMSQAVSSFPKPTANIVSPDVLEVKKELEEKPITITPSVSVSGVTPAIAISSPMTFTDHSFSAVGMKDVSPASQPINIMSTQSPAIPISVVPQIKVAEPIILSTPAPIAPEIKVAPPVMQTPVVSAPIAPEIKVAPPVMQTPQTPPIQTFQKPTGPTSAFSPKVIAPLGFSALSKMQEQKTLEPSAEAPFASSRLGTFQIKPLNQMGSFGGAPTANAKTLTPSQTTDFKAQGFTAGNPMTATPMTKPTIGFVPPSVQTEQTPPAESKPISNPNMFGSKSFNLSPHLQSGMMPSTEAVKANVREVTTPILTPTVPPTAKAFNPFAIGQKPTTVIPTNPGQLQIQTTMRPMIVKTGRKLFGTIVLLIGVVLGATGMHAYLSGYFDPAVNWAKTTIPGMSNLNVGS